MQSLRKFSQRVFNILYMLTKTAYTEIIHYKNVILVNATSYPSNKNGIVPEYKGNIGDDLNFWLLERLVNKKVAHYRYSIIGRRILNRMHYLFIGSIITGMSNKKSIIIGAGVAPNQTPIPMTSPARIICVRGPKSRQYLAERGIDCPSIYGDPALLLPLVLPPQL